MGSAGSSATMAAQVFISYVRKDRERVLPVVQQFRDRGVSVWIDESSIDGAQLWQEQIALAIQECQLLILMVSAASVASVQVVSEVHLAREAKRPILPLFL